jgi:hypothetical protein
MPTSAGAIMVFAGAVLIVVGLLGGGIEAKEVKIPQLTLPPRVASFLVGCILISVGIYSQRLFEPSSPDPRPITNDRQVERGSAITNHLIEVVQVKTILDHLDFYNGPINNDVDEVYFKAVANYQRSKNITQDGLVGPETLGKLREAWPDFFDKKRIN